MRVEFIVNERHIPSDKCSIPRQVMKDIKRCVLFSAFLWDLQRYLKCPILFLLQFSITSSSVSEFADELRTEYPPPASFRPCYFREKLDEAFAHITREGLLIFMQSWTALAGIPFDSGIPKNKPGGFYEPHLTVQYIH